MNIVLDANILIAFALEDEPLHSQAHLFLQEAQTSASVLVAPRLFRSELTAVMRKVVYQGRITHQQGRALLEQLLAYPVVFYEDEALLKSAYELAEYFKRPRAYDSQYLALAERLACAFWTADQRLFHAVSGDFKLIRCLGQ
jgi:predicted nucleic acid-binding protein